MHGGREFSRMAVPAAVATATLDDFVTEPWATVTMGEPVEPLRVPDSVGLPRRERRDVGLIPDRTREQGGSGGQEPCEWVEGDPRCVHFGEDECAQRLRYACALTSDGVDPLNPDRPDRVWHGVSRGKCQKKQADGKCWCECSGLPLSPPRGASPGGGAPSGDQPLRPPAQKQLLSTCLEWAQEIEEIATESSNMAAFVNAMGILKDERRAHPYPPRRDGFNASSRGNGEHNVAHYAATIYYGPEAAWYVVVDRWERWNAKSEAEKAETDAEIYADLASPRMLEVLDRCLRERVNYFSNPWTHEGAWKHCRHITWEWWIKLFCETWG